METFIGGYQLLDRVGRGGFATVWRARAQAGHNVVLKVLDNEFAGDLDRVNRMLQEFGALMRLDHPNIVPVHAVVPHNSVPVLVMEYVPGRDLARHLSDGGALSLDRTFALLAELGAALEHAHDCGVIHRDVKPANIMLESGPEAAIDDGTVSDGWKRVRLTDFGIARLKGAARQTAAGQVVCSPSYTAPELIRGVEATPAADMYSVGLVAYECLSGVPLFKEDNIAATFERQLKEKPLLPNVWPPGFTNLIAALLEKDPASRPSSAEFLRELNALREQATVADTEGRSVTREAQQPTAWSTVSGHLDSQPMATTATTGSRRMSRVRRKWTVAGGGVAAVVLIALVVLMVASSGDAGGLAVLPPDRGGVAGADAAETGTTTRSAVAGAPGDVDATTSGASLGEDGSDTGAPGARRTTKASETGFADNAGRERSSSSPPSPQSPAPTSTVPRVTTSKEPTIRAPQLYENNERRVLPDGGPQAVATSVNVAAERQWRVGDPGVSVIVEAQIAHEKRGDLRVYLLSPDGHRYGLVSPNPRDHRSNCHISVDIADGLPQGAAVTGTWRLVAADTVAGNTGSLESWSLTV